jgi:hypothetical protein
MFNYFILIYCLLRIKNTRLSYLLSNYHIIYIDNYHWRKFLYIVEQENFIKLKQPIN